MGVLLKDPDEEKSGLCPYCYDGTLAFDEQSGRIFCERCGYAVKLEYKKANILNTTINYNPVIKYLKNNVECMRDIDKVSESD